MDANSNNSEDNKCNESNENNESNESNKCATGNRCVKCRKINLKREVKLYQKLRSAALESNNSHLLDRISSACGIPDSQEACRVILDLVNLYKATEHILITPQRLQSLLNQRAKIGRLRRGIQNRIEKEKIDTAKKKTKFVKYDPTSGICFPDAIIENCVREFFEKDYTEITVGQELFVHFARAYSLKHSRKLVLRFEDEDLEVIDGRVSKWPKGFCDKYDEALEMLLFPNENKNI